MLFSAEDFLAGEEDGGEEGIGADPDRAMDYDYSTLAAAMGEDSDMSGEDDSDQDQDEGARHEKQRPCGQGGQQGICVCPAQQTQTPHTGTREVVPPGTQHPGSSFAVMNY